MRVYGWKSATISMGVILCVAMLLSAAPAPPSPQATQAATHEIALTLDPAQSKVHFNVEGIITIHGTDHELVADVHSEFTGDHWKATAKFDVPYTKWGIKDPSNFLLKVKPVVNVELELAGTKSNAQ